MKKQLLLTAVSAAIALTSPMTMAADDELNFDAYREMLADGNPAELYEMEGEELWRTARGPKNATLEQCDLGLGPGVVEGAAAAQLPRYFADTGKVQDLESRLMHCMETQQGIPSAEIVNGKFLQGERVFYYRTGAMDFACSSCHSQDDKRIRATQLPNITRAEGAAEGWTSWPAYRVSNSQFWTMQHRLWDCFRQQRTAEPVFASDVTIALSVFMAGKGNGAEARWPGVKR